MRRPAPDDSDANPQLCSHLKLCVEIIFKKSGKCDFIPALVCIWFAGISNKQKNSHIPPLLISSKQVNFYVKASIARFRSFYGLFFGG